MKRIFLAFLPLVAFADMNTCYIDQEPNGEWRIVCEGDGLEYEIVNVTNDLYIIENCEELKTALLSTAQNIKSLASLNSREANSANSALTDLEGHVSIPGSYSNSWQQLSSGLYGVRMYSSYLSSAASLMYDQVGDINCGSCPTNNSGGSGSCCDFSSIIKRMIAAEQQRVSISNQLARLLSGLSVITNALYSYDDDLVTQGKTWLYNYYLNTWQSQYDYFPDEEPYSISSILFNSSYSLVAGVSSLNNFFHGEVQPSFTALKSPPTLLYFDSSVEERDYYTYLTNYYFGMVRKDSEIPSNYRTNWFARIETLLAALVFNDGGNTNYYDSSQNEISNSFQQVYDDFEDRMTGISDYSTEQMKLVNKVQSSMYNNLLSFSRAFEDAALPSTVQIINVHKDSGTRSLSSDSIDVSLDVDGKLLNFIEILRSASTLCWVFLGLWMMFKFSVWTVKKIYVLIRYIIDFFNMIIGGK